MSLGGRVPGSLSPVWFPSAWTSPVPCSVPSATHCPVTIHVATENGCGSQRGRRGRRGEARGPLPLPAPQHRASGVPRRKRTGLEHPRESVSLEAPLDQTAPPLGHRERLRGQAQRSVLSGSAPPAPARPGVQPPTPDPRPQTACPAGAVGAVRSGPQAILCPHPDGQSIPDTTSVSTSDSSPARPSPDAPAVPGPQLTFSSLPALPGACASPSTPSLC